MKHRNWILTGLLLVAVLLALIGPMGTRATQAQDLMSRVRFLHAVPGAPEVDVYLDGAVVASGLAFGEVTPHLQVTGGDHKVTLRQAGTDASSPALVEVNVPVSPNLAYTVVAQGKPGALQAALYEDILDEIGVGMARLTAINAIADAPPLDVLTREGGPLLQGVNYGAQFGTININSGVQDLVMVPAGGAVDSAVVDIGTVALESGTLYTLVALGEIDGGTAPFALVIATPVNGAAGTVLVRFAQGSPDASAVDVYANDTLLVPSLGFGMMSGHIALPAGDYTFAVRPAGSPAADPPVAGVAVQLDDSTPAVTVVAVGQVSDQTIALQSFPDNIAGITPDKARISVVNAIPGATVQVTLSDPSATVLASDLAANTQGTAVDVAAGDYMLTASVQGVSNPVDLVVPSDAYDGGVYYSVLVYGGGANAVPYDAHVAGTEVDVTVDSLPKAAPAPVAVASNPTPLPTEETVVVQPTPLPTEVPPTPLPAEAAAPTQTELVTQPAGGSELVAQPTEAVPEATQQPLVPQASQPVAFVELDPGANLQCRELPGADKKSLGLIPSGTTLTVLGRTGTPLVPETGNVTPEPTPVVETIDDLWLSVRWDPPGGGYMRCWVSAQYLRVEFKGKLLDTLDELMALPEEPFNQPGESVGTTITPPTPLFDAVIATVELQPGVSLQLRRDPKTDAESLGLVPAGAQLEVLGYAEVPSEGLVGQPTSPYWLYVRYRTENGGATIGWVSAEYVSLSKLGHTVEITDLVVVDATEGGYYEAPGQAPVIPLEQQKVVGVVNLNPGANLNLRDQPNSDARVVVGIPSGESMILNGRNGDGTWVQVTYSSAAGDLDGWVAVQYLIITRGGQPYDIKQLPILTGEADTMGG
jgi:hypothetical protein